MALVPVVGLGGLWATMDKRVERGDWHITANAPAAAPAALAGPILSLQRQPAILAHDTTDRQLAASVKVVTENVGSSPADPTCFAASLDGRTVIADAADQPVMPASNMKLITAAVALDVLGPDFTFATTANGQLSGDTVEGDLILVGGGDPLLANAGYVPRRKYPTVESPTSIEALADQVAARVRHVTGGIIGDESHFDSERYAPGWRPEDQGGQAGPLSALMLNDARELPDIDTPVDNAALSATQEFARLLGERGVLIDGGTALGQASAPVEELGRVTSVPMAQMVAEMLLNSDNNTAEMVLKQIGATAGGGPGIRDAGVAAETAKLVEWGVPVAGLVINDGSGLDRADRLTCRALLAVLDHVGSSGPLFDGLPISGAAQGTLADPDNRDILAPTGTDGRIHAKTGSLRDAKALSGFFDLADGRKIAFSMLVNGDHAVDRGHILWAAMASGMAAFTGSVSPDAIALAGSG